MKPGKVDTKRLVSAIGPARLTYGAEVAGVGDRDLEQLRSTTAAAFASGFAGKQFDTVLYVADAGPTSPVDPAFAAHTLPIHTWALATWQGWVGPVSSSDDGCRHDW